MNFPGWKNREKDARFLGPQKEALKIAFVFGFFGVLWILLSDRILLFLVQDFALYSRMQTFKGAFYVTITTILIYALVYKRTLVIAEYLERLQSTAYVDRLTRLPNRNKMMQEMEKIISRKHPFTVVYMDLDNFRFVNDTLGHETGDILLEEVADKFRDYIQEHEFAARISGDDFGLIIPGDLSRDTLEKRLETLLESFGNTWRRQNHQFFISFSIGVARYPHQGGDAAELLKKANIAMYQGKHSGKKQIVWYEASQERRVTDHVEMANRLQEAIEKDLLTLHFQAKFELETGKIQGLEALIRWYDKEKGYISPGVFIPVAEDTGQIFNIDQLVFRKVLEEKGKLESNGLENLELSVNLSGKMLMSDTGFPALLNILSESAVDRRGITVEITETALIHDMELALERIQALRDLGLQIALDDFGTGFSSLNHLKNLPIQILKLDRSFISQITDGNKESHIIRSVISLARELQLEVVAEGIETEAQKQILQQYGCHLGQGFLLHRPEPIEKILNNIRL